MRGIAWTVLIFLLLPLAAGAQASPSFSLNESAINNGGDPVNGVALSSVSYRITLDSIGDSVSGGVLSSASYSMDPGVVPSNMPAGEVLNLRFYGKTALSWSAECSVGAYNVYRGTSKNDWPCLHQNLTSASDSDAETPTPGQVFCYLVTAENRLGEQGTLGKDSAGTQRVNAHPCP